MDQLSEKLDVQEATLHSDRGFQYPYGKYNKRVKELAEQAVSLANETGLITPTLNSFFASQNGDIVLY